MSLMDQGWYCVLKLTTIPTGCNIQVESDIDMPSAQCADRLMMAAQKMRVYEAGEATQ
ncbi:MAG: hypothetical protein JNM52_00200 [Betaproteobacteria bacterium]|nr:hypothetical protein [Betaproteobacteria bacterium]